MACERRAPAVSGGPRMYRLIFPLLVCACAVGGAPRDSTALDGLVRRARQAPVGAEPTDGADPTETFPRAPRPTRPSPSPRFISKLSYFDKASVPSDDRDVSANLLGRGDTWDKSYRKFTSTCRCEKIWNCPRLQITVPRCPDEYFLCCNL